MTEPAQTGRSLFDEDLSSITLRLLSDERGAVGEDAPCVLLVEDYQPNVLVVTTYLEYFGYRCETVTTGEDALEKVRQKDYAVVLMDVQMEGMGGYAATRAIRQHEDGKDRRCHIIGMTARALTGDKEKCLEAGMDDYLAKPFNPEDLKAKLLQAAPPKP